MEDRRLERLEDKVDRIEEVVVEIKTSMRHYNDKVEAHAEADAVAIKTIAPILEKLPQIVEIVEEYQFEKKKTQEKKDNLKLVTMKVGLIATIVGMVTAISRVL